MNISSSRLPLLLAGLPLRLALTLAAAIAAASVWDITFGVREALALTLLSVSLRALIRLQCGFKDSLGSNSDFTLLFNNFKSEIKYALGFMTVLYLAEFPIARSVVLTFIVLNMIIQFIPFCVSQMIFVTRKGKSGLPGSGAPGLTNNSQSDAASRTALVYGTGRKGKLVVDMLLTNPHSDITPIGFIDPHASGLWSYRDTPLIGGLKALRETILNRQVDLLFIAAEHKDLQHSQAVFDIAERMGVPVCVMPHIYQSTVSECRLKMFNGRPALVYSSAKEEGLSTVVKEILDKLIAGAALIIVSPLMALTAALIKMTSTGPVLFRQTRLGINGAPFTLFKFRSMTADAEQRKDALAGSNEMSGPVFKIKHDPRITPVGRFIRKYSIDELPQLLNVLRGDMSLVGPRPALPDEVSRFETWQRRKLAVKPGVTCTWQVSGRNVIDFDDWMKLDLEYIDNWSLWLDTKILARTIPTVLKGAGQ